MAKFGHAVDHLCMSPQGRVSRNKGWPLSSADKRDRQRSRTVSYVSTSRMRAKLGSTQVVQQDDSSWGHVVDGVVVASFETVTAAVAAL